MSRRRIRRLKNLTIILSAGCLFGSLSCVQTVADTVGTGLSITGTMLGPNGQAASGVGAGLDLLADILRFGT